MSVDVDTLRAGLANTLAATRFPGAGAFYEGKVRDNYSLGRGRRAIVVTDRISAFDRVLGTLPFKGQVLNRVSAFWFESTRDIAPNHLLDVPDPNVMICTECEPLAVEMVVRAYLTGVTSTSIWTHYARGVRTYAGHTLPDGLARHAPLPAPIVTPSTKAKKGDHDVTVSRGEIVASGAVSARDFDEASRMVLDLFAHGQRVAAARGLILVDTKYELGRAPDGRLLVIDEMHTPDSSRYWVAESYESRMAAGDDPESLDKEFVRRWLAAEGYTGEGDPPALPDELRVEAARRYVEAAERVSGLDFVPELGPPLPRVRRALERAAAVVNERREP